MAKNNLLDCIEPIKAIEFLIIASGITRNKLFSDAGITSNSGYNCLQYGKTISCENWYALISRLPEPLYQLYLKLITRVHKDTPLEGTLHYDPFLFYTKREIDPHPVNDVLNFLITVYQLDINEISYHTNLRTDVLRLYLVRNVQKPRLDRLWLILSAFPLNLVLEFEWIMRNVHSRIPLSELKYTHCLL
jgi:hypothetical protein